MRVGEILVARIDCEWLTPALVEKLLAERAGGAALQKLADVYGVAERTVVRIDAAAAVLDAPAPQLLLAGWAAVANPLAAALETATAAQTEPAPAQPDPELEPIQPAPAKAPAAPARPKPAAPQEPAALSDVEARVLRAIIREPAADMARLASLAGANIGQVHKAADALKRKRYVAIEKGHRRALRLPDGRRMPQGENLQAQVEQAAREGKVTRVDTKHAWGSILGGDLDGLR